jgi:hypothetical protein
LLARDFDSDIQTIGELFDAKGAEREAGSALIGGI